MPDNRQKVAQLFPRASEVPKEHDVGFYEDGDRWLVDGEIRRFGGALVEVESPVCIRGEDGSLERKKIGAHAALGADEAKLALDSAVRAYGDGRGEWPTMSVARRLERLRAFADGMRAKREIVVKLLMWEIGKSLEDSQKEFDRTHEYIKDTIEALRDLDRQNSRFAIDKGVIAQIRRAPLGVALCMGPFNYPLNEAYTTLIPALAMGNTVVTKLPRFGMLSNLPLLEAFRDSFPRGVVNVLNGDGKTLIGPIMTSGKIDVLAFIGAAKTGDTIKKQHPFPHRLRSIMGLDAKNPAIVLEDADLDLAVRECVKGTLSFNGQRCTALKLLLVNEKVAERFVARFVEEVEKLPCGMPWERVSLTPLPEPGKVERLQALVADATKKGARVVNPSGGASNATFYFPSVVFPVTKAMELYHVEQFGPIVPIATFQDLEEVFAHAVASPYGQQASVFGRNPKVLGPLLDVLVNQVCRVNLNAQCQRGPDSFPFTGRKDSAEATLSVTDALRCFSIRSMVAASYDDYGKQVLGDLVMSRESRFLRTDFLF
ncbi:NADP-dependent glyceraldehyde-3-phosphate dehydrogenase [bacterium]|nr:NADP-dependent glyceraldehyde-3-phosphate dehydrogenase [bacterium]